MSDIETRELYAAPYRRLLGQLIGVADVPMEKPAMTVDFDAHGIHLGIQVRREQGAQARNGSSRRGHHQSP